MILEISTTFTSEVPPVSRTWNLTSGEFVVENTRKSEVQQYRQEQRPDILHAEHDDELRDRVEPANGGTCLWSIGQWDSGRIR